MIDQYQIIKDTKKYRPKSNYPIYPPYHDGYYFEEYFFNYYIKNNIETDRLYIPIFWTNINNNTYYNNNKKIKFNNYLKTLNYEKKYFTVCQHEDFTEESNLEPDEKSLENLPKDILIFSGSGKITDKVKLKNIICIPHVVSKIKNPILNKKRDIFCSFVGSFNTHPIRQEIYNIYKDDKDFYFGGIQKWNVKIEKDKEDEFKDITERSIFALCPRDNGPTSYRLYEVMQLGAIPIFVYDNKWIPWEDDIKWDDICIFIHTSEISCLKTLLLNISNDEINQMKNNINDIYDKYFTLDKVCETIIDKLNKEIYG